MGPPPIRYDTYKTFFIRYKYLYAKNHVRMIFHPRLLA